MMENSILLNENPPFSGGVRKIYCEKLEKIFPFYYFPLCFEKQFL